MGVNPESWQEAGFANYLQKPVSLADLQLRFEQILNPRVAPEPAVEPLPAIATQQAALHILVAEDNKVNSEVLRFLLKKLGHRMTLAENGKEAIQCLGEGTFDLILMDMVMPVMDGCTAARQIRSGNRPEIPKDIPIIALTANVGQENRELCLAAGMNDFLAKPLDLKRLQEKIKDIAAGGAAAEKDPPNVLSPRESVNTQEVIDRLDGDLEAVEVANAAFCADAGRQLELLLLALEEADLVLLKRQAHSLKGAALNVGAQNLASQAETIENQAGSGERLRLTELCEQLAAETRKVIQILGKTVPQPAQEEIDACLNR